MADKPIPEELTMQDMYQHGVRVGHQECEVIIGRVEQTVESQRKLLDKYDADNTKLLHENAKLKAQVKRLSAPLTWDSPEWWKYSSARQVSISNGLESAMSMTQFNDFISARLAGKEPAWGTSENLTVLPEEEEHHA
jgi:hypothetical protein